MEELAAGCRMQDAFQVFGNLAVLIGCPGGARGAQREVRANLHARDRGVYCILAAQPPR